MCKMTRREFLLKASACAGYYAAYNVLSPLNTGIAWAASSCTNNRKVLVHVFLDGGLDSPSLLVPRNIQSYFDKRPTIQITNPLVIDSRYGLNPALTNTASLLAQGKAAVINKIGYPQPTQSHEDSKNVYSRATRNSGLTNTGWAGRFGDLYCAGNSNVASVLSFRGQTKDISAQRYVATTLNNLGQYNYTNDSDTNDSRFRRMVITGNRNYDVLPNSQAAAVNNSWGVVDNAVTTMQAVNTSYTSPIVYPNNGLAQRFRDAAKLIKSNENPSVILLSQGGYDTHGDELLNLTNNFTQLDGAIGAFMADLANMGRADDVLVTVFTEFGRNTYENSTNGTDHGEGTMALVYGNNVNGGVHGPEYAESDFASRRYLPGVVDFREILSSAIGTHLGVDPTPLFPEAFARAGLSVIR